MCKSSTLPFGRSLKRKAKIMAVDGLARIKVDGIESRMGRQNERMQIECFPYIFSPASVRIYLTQRNDKLIAKIFDALNVLGEIYRNSQAIERAFLARLERIEQMHAYILFRFICVVASDLVDCCKQVSPELFKQIMLRKSHADSVNTITNCNFIMHYKFKFAPVFTPKSDLRSKWNDTHRETIDCDRAESNCEQNKHRRTIIGSLLRKNKSKLIYSIDRKYSGL